MRTIAFLVTLLFGTLWHGGACILAGLFRVPWRKGGVYDLAQRRWSRQLLKATGIPVTIEGAEHLASDGPQIVVANHASFFDIVALLAYLPVDAKFIAKKELYAIPVFGGAIRAAGHVRIDRGNQKQAFSAYDHAAREMQAKKLTVVVYPEGTRTRTGDLLPFKKGPFVFAIGAGAPIVPCYVGGAFGIQPKGSIRVRRRHLHICLGAPIRVAGFDLKERDALMERVRGVMEEMKVRTDAMLAAERTESPVFVDARPTPR